MFKQSSRCVTHLICTQFVSNLSRSYPSPKTRELHRQLQSEDTQVNRADIVSSSPNWMSLILLTKSWEWGVRIFSPEVQWYIKSYMLSNFLTCNCFKLPPMTLTSGHRSIKITAKIISWPADASWIIRETLPLTIRKSRWTFLFVLLSDYQPGWMTT